MIKYAKEVPLRLHSIRFTLEYYNWFRVNSEIKRETSAILDKICFGSHLGLVNSHFKIMWNLNLNWENKNEDQKNVKKKSKISNYINSARLGIFLG